MINKSQYQKIHTQNLNQNEADRKWRLFEEEQAAFNMQISGSLSPSGSISTPPSSGDLTLVFSSFDTVDLILTGGYDSLPDWNIAIVGAGNPYTSISVDEPNFIIYLSGGSNITLDPNAFTGQVEGAGGLGHDLVSIVDVGTIIESNGYTFNYCGQLETVILPALAEVVFGDFTACPKLRNVQLPSVTAVGDNGFYSAFNTADSPISLNIPLCTSLGTNAFTSEYEGVFYGTTEVDSPKVMTVTIPGSIAPNPAWTLFLSQNSGVVPNYV
jgi:hypothetical protein